MRSRANQDVDVTGMQKVEHAVREDDAALLAFAPIGERLPRHRFSLRVERT